MPMRFLVRRVTDGAPSSDQEYQSDALVLGSHADSDVLLPGLRGIIRLSVNKKGVLSFAIKGGNGTLAGRSVRKGQLSTDAQLEVDGYSIRALDAPAGFDTGLSIAGAVDASQLWQEQLDFEARLPSLRKLGYGALALVLLFGALFPALSLLDEPTRSAVRSSPLTDDSFWNSGPISRAHTTAGVAMACEACHEQPFVTVRDQSCLGCHADMKEHVAAANAHADLFAGASCAGCHREHNEPEWLARQDKGLCVECHAEPGEWDYTGQGSMAAVSGFTKQQHPRFRLALWRPQGPEAALGWARERVRLTAAAGVSETSMLKFNHAVHMDPDKVAMEASGQPMACADCHVPRESGEHFEAISMDSHCRSCHSLSFDVFDPDIELPHGEVRAVVTAMEAHFIREFTDPLLRAERAQEKSRRVPGKRTSATVCDGDGLTCGRAEAMKEAAYQFTESGCITCHQVTDTGLTNIMDRFRVHPAKVAVDWYPEARFLHSAHRYGGADPDEACLSCHEALSSELATDVLIPNRDNCLACHDESRDGVAAECTACHGFHRDVGGSSVEIRLAHPNHPRVSSGGG